MRLFRFVLHTSPGMFGFVLLTSLLSGALNAGLIAAVNAALHRSASELSGLGLAFMAFGLGKLGTSFVSQMSLVRFSQRAVSRLQQSLVRKILGTPLRHLEVLGVPRIMAALTDDVAQITIGLRGIPVLAVNVALLAGGAIYLGWLSSRALVGGAALAAIGALCHRHLARSGFAALREGREQQVRLFGHFRALTEGIKELKLHRERRGAFLSDHVAAAAEGFTRSNVVADGRFIMAQHVSTLLFYSLIGAVLFLLPELIGMPRSALSGYVLTILYLMGPMMVVMGSFSYLGRASVALEKVEALGISLLEAARERFPVAPGGGPRSFESARLSRVTHAYPSERSDERFVLGPVDLTFSPGEIVFIVGGNGSGKSTLARVLTGLYPPEEGEVLLDGRIIDDGSRDDYRQLFSAVFSDYHLFESAMGLGAEDLDEQARRYLRDLQLDHKVRIEAGVFSTLDLSQGQRKRLSLLIAYLEDRPFYLFDEWAADQDPQFKRIFYTRLLPELARRGKAVVAITHDDMYFHLADRIIKLDSGQVVADTRRARGPAAMILPGESPRS